jgi:hypothetical protein
MESRSEQIILAIVERTLPVIFSKPKLVVELHPDLFAHAGERIEEQLRSSGFAGELQFKGNSAFQLADITLDWGAGQVQRSTDNLWEEVEAIITRVPLELTFMETLNTYENPVGEEHGG